MRELSAAVAAENEELVAKLTTFPVVLLLFRAIADLREELARVEKQNSDMRWQLNPDRMGG
jgi:hypothetical protein